MSKRKKKPQPPPTSFTKELEDNVNAAAEWDAPEIFWSRLRFLIGSTVATNGALWLEAEDGELRITQVMPGGRLIFKLSKDGSFSMEKTIITPKDGEAVELVHGEDGRGLVVKKGKHR